MKKVLITVIVILAAASVYGIRTAYFKRDVAQKAPVVKEERAYPVETITARRRTVQEGVSGVGTVRPNLEVTVVSKVTGTVEEVFKDVGDLVRKGERLARIEDALIRWEVREAQARLAEARSNLEKMKSLSRPEEIRTKRAFLNSAEARLVNAQKEYERMGRLYAEGIVARERLEAADMALKVAKAEYEVAKEQLALTESGARREDLEMAEARLKQAEARLAQVERRLTDTIVESPIDGLISQKFVEAGGGVSALSPLFKIIDISRVKVVVDVAERDLRKVRAGGEARVSVDSLPGEFKGEVTNIHPQGDITSRTFPVEVTVENPDLSLRPGQVARLSIAGRSLGELVVIPKDSVLVDADGPFVYTINSGRARKQPVTLGPRRGEEVIIFSGLIHGDQVVVVGQDNLAHGAQVEVVRKR